MIVRHHINLAPVRAAHPANLCKVHSCTMARCVNRTLRIIADTPAHHSDPARLHTPAGGPAHLPWSPWPSCSIINPRWIAVSRRPSPSPPRPIMLPRPACSMHLGNRPAWPVRADTDLTADALGAHSYHDDAATTLGSTTTYTLTVDQDTWLTGTSRPTTRPPTRTAYQMRRRRHRTPAVPLRSVCTCRRQHRSRPRPGSLSRKEAPGRPGGYHEATADWTETMPPGHHGQQHGCRRTGHDPCPGQT